MTAEGGVTGSTSTTLDFTLGLINNQTCFLTGVGGQLIGDPQIGGGANPDTLGAHVGVFAENDGHWHFKAQAGTGGAVGGSAMCIDSVANRVSIPWSDNLTAQPLGGSVSSPRRCFLQKVWGTSGFTNNCRFNPNVTIQTDPTWGFPVSLGGFVCNVGGDSGFGGGTAVCVDTIAPDAGGGVTFRPSSGPDPVNTTVPVRGDTACGVIGIDGLWATSTTNGMDGIFLESWARGSNLPTWLAQWSGVRHGTVQCIAGP